MVHGFNFHIGFRVGLADLFLSELRTFKQGPSHRAPGPLEALAV